MIMHLTALPGTLSFLQKIDAVVIDTDGSFAGNETYRALDVLDLVSILELLRLEKGSKLLLVSNITNFVRPLENSTVILGKLCQLVLEISKNRKIIILNQYTVNTELKRFEAIKCKFI